MCGAEGEQRLAGGGCLLIPNRVLQLSEFFIVQSTLILLVSCAPEAALLRRYRTPVLQMGKQRPRGSQAQDEP